MSGNSNSIFKSGTSTLTPAQEAMKEAVPVREAPQNAQAPAQPKVISPSIGRVLWYWPSKEYKESEGAQAQVAHCCYVHSDRLVNIAGFDCNGGPWSQTSVTLRQPEDKDPNTGAFVEWMPYQIGAAAK